MTIMSTLRQGPPEIDKPKMTFPFLWRRSDGIVFIRCVGKQDVAIGGTLQLYNVGSLSQSITSDADAWNQRLDANESIILRNFLS